jgi:hypothetical protein
MGKLLKALGVVFLVLVVLFAGLLFWGARKGAELQGKFFAAVGSGKTDQVLKLMDPVLVADIDEPVLAAWMTAFNAKLGPFQALRKTDLSTSARLVDGDTVTESKGVVDFQSGSAKSELVFRNGLLLKFHIQSEQLGNKWFQGPADKTLYRERGKQLLTHLAKGESEQAFAMMHEDLRQAMPLDKLQKSGAAMREETGPLKSIAWEKDEWDGKDGPRLDVHYRAEFEKKSMAGLVRFHFQGLKAHILKFSLSDADRKASSKKK